MVCRASHNQRSSAQRQSIGQLGAEFGVSSNRKSNAGNLVDARRSSYPAVVQQTLQSDWRGWRRSFGAAHSTREVAQGWWLCRVCCQQWSVAASEGSSQHSCLHARQWSDAVLTAVAVLADEIWAGEGMAPRWKCGVGDLGDRSYGRGLGLGDKPHPRGKCKMIKYTVQILSSVETFEVIDEFICRDKSGGWAKTGGCAPPACRCLQPPLHSTFNSQAIRSLFTCYYSLFTRYSLFAVFFLVSTETITTIFIRQNSRKPERATVHPSLAHH